MVPQDVLAVRHKSDGAAEVLIQWKNLPECEDSWELLQEMNNQFPEAHLEDKVVVREGGSVRDKMYGLVYKRRNRRERADRE